MSTLIDRQIRSWGQSGGIEPFNPALINPASVNIRIGNTLKVESPGGTMYDVDISDCNYERPFLVDPGEFILNSCSGERC